VEPDGGAVPLPVSRPLTEVDLTAVRFDTAVRGYRMAQVDQALRRAAYDLGYKEELINVLEAEVGALREGRAEDAEALRKARESAARPPVPDGGPPIPAAPAAAVPIEAGDTVATDVPVDGDAPPATEVPVDGDAPPATEVPVDGDAPVGGDGPAGAADAAQAAVEVSVVSGPAGEKADAQQ
jgi:DivIVA domain-containing protein